MRISRSPATALAALVASGGLLLGAAGVAAQGTGTIQGVVVEAQSQRPLASAQVYIAGTGIGTLTNAEGRYLLLNVPAGQHDVRIQLIGYGTQEQQATVTAGQTTTLDFELGLSAIALDEVVVTGQGRARERKQLPTTIDVISAQDLALSPAISLDQVLQGRVAGGTVNATSAQPGTAGLINFRGVSSVFGAQTPVIYVDGVRVDNDMTTAMGTGGEQSSALADLLAADIERIEVTRGGAASTLYGSDAATGVIQIFTKKGNVGAPRVTFRVEQGFDQPELKYILDAGKIWDGIIPAADLNPNFLKDDYFKTGAYQNYYAGVSGGTAQFTYSVSGRISDGTGIQPKNENQLFALRGGIQAQVNDQVRLDFSGNYTRTQFGRLYNGTAIADPITALEVGDALWLSSASTLEESLDQFTMPDINEEVNRFIFSSALQYQPVDFFQARFSVGLDNRSSLNRIYEPIGWIVASSSGGQGAVYRYNRDFNSVSMEMAGSLTYPQTATYTNTFTFGAQGFRDDVTTIYGEGLAFALPGAPEIDEAGDITASETNSELFNGGLFFEDQFGLWDRIFINAGLRLDANTTFGDEVSTKAYPKLGASYMLSEEQFFQDLLGSFLSDLKLRGAYGQTGKFPPPFLRDRTYSATSFRGQSAPRFDNPGNPDLGPEVVSTLEFGADIAMLGNRIGLGITWYNANTRDALFEVPEPPVTGLTSQVRNVGEIGNTGWEIEGHAQLLNTRDLQWNIGATFNAVDNRVLDMGAAAPFWIGGTYQRVCGPPNDCIPGSTGLEELPVGAWLVDTPIDTNGDGMLDDTERFYLCDDGTLSGEACDTYASPLPRHNGSISTDVTFHNRLTLSMLADWATGFWVHDWGSMWATYNGIYRRELVDGGYQYPHLHDLSGNDLGSYGPYSAISEFVYDGDFMKLREISASYAVPEAWSARIGADQATLYMSVRNVFIWSKNDLVDPELHGLTSGEDLDLGGSTSVTISPPRMFRFGIQLAF